MICPRHHYLSSRQKAHKAVALSVQPALFCAAVLAIILVFMAASVVWAVTLSTLSVSVACKFLQGRVVSPVPNPQTGG